MVRQQFMAAAAELIHVEGFQALRVEEIAERAGLSIGSFYLYFESKEDLFVTLVIRLHGTPQASTRQCLQDRRHCPGAHRTGVGCLSRLRQGD